ncbi:phospholipase C type enzyme [Lecanora helva]
MNAQSRAPSTLNIVSLNCFGLKYISGFRKERLAEIGRRLASAHPVPEIVGLQECWTQEDYNSIREATKQILPSAKFYYSGIFGGGLAILSKWPIEESSMARYPLNGRPTAFFRGDWFVGKGVACARVRIGPLSTDVIEVFCTHLHAPYESGPNDSYICHRTAQAWEIAKLMRGAVERGHLVIGLGDFNMLPLSLAHQLITAHAPVVDAWRVLHPDSSIGPANSEVERKRGREMPTASYNLAENGTASDGVLNTWRWSKAEQKRLFKGESITVSSDTPDPKAKRLDYIFVGKGAPTSDRSESNWRIKDIKVGMTERHPTIGCSLSDHFSMEATLSRSDEPSIITNQDICAGTRNANAKYCDKKPLPISAYDTILSMITNYTYRELRQRRFRISNFFVSIVVAIGCLIAVWWSPRPFVSFLLMLLSTLGFGAGVLDGLIGGLFINSELRALREFEWEIQNAKERAQRMVEGKQEVSEKESGGAGA